MGDTDHCHPAHLKDAMLKTKICCTIGPASLHLIPELVEAGMSVARINMAHASYDFCLSAIQNLRSYLKTSRSTAQVAIWLDLNGPKVRTGKLVNGEPVWLEEGSEFCFVNDRSVIGDHTKVATNYEKEIVQVGDVIFVDDGHLSFTVLSRTDNGIRCTIDNSGYLGECKGVNFARRELEDNLPALSTKDKQDIYFALENDIDFISISCIRSVEDMQEIRFMLGTSKIRLIAKIENKHGLDNFEGILKIADAIVIDRGYLGAEVDYEEVPTAQKEMIALSNSVGKPVWVANQVMESMKSHPRPTRSEAADVTNAVMDGCDGLVLSSETAVGKYVVESVKVMSKVIFAAEKRTDYQEFQLKQMRNAPKPIGVSESIASSAVACARQVGATVIICITEYGGTARLVAKYRPQVPVLAATHIQKTAKQLNMCFGVFPYYYHGNPEAIVTATMKNAIELGLCKPGDVAVITSGQTIGFADGTTTKMQMRQIPAL